MRDILGWMAALVILGGCGKKAASPPTTQPASQDAAAPVAVADAPTTATPDAAAPAAVADATAKSAPEATAAEDTGAPAPADAGTAPKPGAKRPAPGVVSAEHLDSLYEELGEDDRPDEKAVAAEAALFEGAGRCVEAPGDCSTLPWGIIAVKGKGVAIRVADRISSCADIDQSQGWTASLPALEPTDKKPLFAGPDGDEPATWKWVAGLAKDGWKHAPSLVRATGVVFGGVHSQRPIALLRAPLAGWMIDASNDAKEPTFVLVSPDNQKKYPLGAVPSMPNKECSGADRKDGTCGLPNVMEVALSADGKSLLLLGSLGAPLHCGSDQTFLRGYPLPPDALH